MNIASSFFAASDRVASFLARLMSPAFFIGAVLGMLVVLGLIIYKPLTEFHMTDPMTEIVPFTPRKQTNGAEAAVPVHVGMFIQNFPVFDVIANSFTSDLILWFQFDPSLIPLETIQKFSFDRATILRITEADMKMKGKKLFVQYGIRLAFSSPLDHTLFPLNDHRINIILRNEYVTPSEIIFEAPRSSFIVAPKVHTSDWNIADRSTQTGYFKEKLDELDPSQTLEFPAAVFSIDLEKKGFRKIFIIMLPLLLLFIISVFTLLMDPKPLARSILTLSTGTLTGVIAYRFVIEKIIPDVGYFTLTDHMFNLFLTGIFVIFVVNIFIVRKGEEDKQSRILKVLTLVIVEFLIIATFYYLLRSVQ